jgi:hypothetical protein
LVDPANKVEAIRADVLAGVPHGFLGRRGVCPPAPSPD